MTAFAKLPGIGRKSALRLVLHLLYKDSEAIIQLSEALIQLKNEIKFCNRCNNISDAFICSICSNTTGRNQSVLCVVESVKDVLSIENTQQFNGVYHVLGGLIAPLDGIGPDQLNIQQLVERVRNEKVEELIFALNPNIQGDTTIFYIQKLLKDVNCKSTTLARGISFGGELEYADEMTLGKSITNRLPLQKMI